MTSKTLSLVYKGIAFCVEIIYSRLLFPPFLPQKLPQSTKFIKKLKKNEYPLIFFVSFSLQ